MSLVLRPLSLNIPWRRRRNPRWAHLSLDRIWSLAPTGLWKLWNKRRNPELTIVRPIMIGWLDWGRMTINLFNKLLKMCTELSTRRLTSWKPLRLDIYVPTCNWRIQGHSGRGLGGGSWCNVSWSRGLAFYFYCNVNNVLCLYVSLLLAWIMIYLPFHFIFPSCKMW